MARCGRRRADGGRCRRRVADGSCPYHGGMYYGGPKQATAKTYRPRTTQPRSQPSRPAPTRLAPRSARAQPQRPPTGAELRELRLRAAAAYVADALWDGWDQAVAERVATYLTRRTWKRITSRWRPRRGCHLLAQLARDILEGKHDLHEVAAWAASTLAGVMGRPNFERVFAAELAQRIPQPTDRPLEDLARSVRIIGVMRCFTARLDNCECLLDLTEAEGKEHARQLLLAAADNYWTTHYQTPSPPPQPPS
jgi:hypothetical protein